jgi:hypothetical protein
MHVILLATHWTPTFENCRRSLHVHNYTYTVLQWKETWKGWMWRVKSYYDHLLTLDDMTVVIIMDSYDTLMTKSSSDILSTFEAFKKPIVIGCEWWCGNKDNCGKVDEWWKANNKQPAHRCYINAGVIIGQVKQLKQMYKWVLHQQFTDDQLGIASYINQFGHDNVALDFGSSLIYNGHILDGFKPNKTAFIHHYPGPLLKLGFMPLYNKTVELILGVYARKIYPDFKQELLLKLIMISSMMYLLFSLHK